MAESLTQLNVPEEQLQRADTTDTTPTTDEVCADEKNLTTPTSPLAEDATSNAPVGPTQPSLLAPSEQDGIASAEIKVTGSQVVSNSQPDIEWASKMSAEVYDSDMWIKQHRKYIENEEAIQKIEKLIPSRYQDLPTKYDVRNYQWNAERLRCIITETNTRLSRRTFRYRTWFKIEGWSGGQLANSFSVLKSRLNDAFISFDNEFNLLCVLACQSEQRDQFQFTSIDFVFIGDFHSLRFGNIQWDVLGGDCSFGESFQARVLLWNQCWGCQHSLIVCKRSDKDEMTTVLYYRLPEEPAPRINTVTISKKEWMARLVKFGINSYNATLWYEKNLAQNALDSAEYGGPWYSNNADLSRVIMVEEDGDNAWDIYMEVFCCSHLILSRRITDNVPSNSSIIDDLIAPLAFRGGSPLPIHFYVVGSSWPRFNASCVGTSSDYLPEIVMNWTQFWNVPHVLHPKRSSASRAIWYSKSSETLESVSWTTALFGAK